MNSKIASYELDDRYSKMSGRIFMTGTQALVRIMLDQAKRDGDKGMHTQGFVSGYRGSPLGALDLELWRAKDHTSAAKVDFLPAVNEDLAATAVLGTQQVESNPDKTVDGVFSMWYGKGPGVDRSGDALKHGNGYGSSKHGGVLVVAGDDHGCVSSSMSHQSDVAFMSWYMPILNPASVGEYLEYGEYGYALSRYSGMWVGFKAISETVESASSVLLKQDRIFETPAFEMPLGGLHYRWPDLPGPQIEDRMVAKEAAVQAFVKANPIDKQIYQIKDATYGVVTTGKGHLDLMEAFRLLGLGENECRRLGIDIYKVGMVWPLAPDAALEFVCGKREILVIEEKRGIIESQLKEHFYDYPGKKPERMVGKKDENGFEQLTWTGELSPLMLVPVVAKRLDQFFPDEKFIDRANTLLETPVCSIHVEGATRTPYFCSGCPHNTSTKVPEGSKALAGIGCHFMASWMDRDTSSLIQMGGEGVNWAASSRFTGMGHIFQNLGEGTWYHSGSMAIRQSIAAKANITYKILYNDAVAMTGGQPVDGPVSVESIALSARAEGVERIALVSDMPDKFDLTVFPKGVTLHHRRELDAVQKELREIKGTSVLIYEQACATEKRRRRKRGTMDDPKRFAVINELVCEGCGDCSVASNCLSVEPVKTVFGNKRRINLSNCNKDFSCLDGFCPSFVTVENAVRRKKDGVDLDVDLLVSGLKAPKYSTLDKPYDVLVTGVGGTGVVTVGALITMAAHIEGKGSSVLDFTGFAQKFGPVLSFIRLAQHPDDINQVRIDNSAADALIGGDFVVSSSPKASACYHMGTKTVMNMAEMPTGDIVRHRDASLRPDERLAAISNAVGADNIDAFDANRVAEKLLGDTVFANIILLGYAWQKGLVPVSLAALTRAITLNGVAIDKNNKAFAIGRIAAGNIDAVSKAMSPPTVSEQTIDEIINTRADFLTGYQNAAYADRYRQMMNTIIKADSTKAGNTKADNQEISITAAKSLFKLMAYKDEYEVARLHSQMGFNDKLKQEFEDGFTVNYHLAPPMLSRGLDARGRPRKRSFGPWVGSAFKILTKMKGLRGSRLDIFGYTAERKMERALIVWYSELLNDCSKRLTTGNAALWKDILEAPMTMRGYGPVKEDAVQAAKEKVEEFKLKL